MKDKHKKLLQASLLLLTSVLTGITGYMLIENYDYVDALYMSVITISTVGYGELNPLTDNGKIFTSLYIVLNLGIFAYVVSIFTTYLVEGELSIIFKNIFNRSEIKSMKNHTIICGFGRNGSKASEELIKNNTDILVIETNDEMMQNLTNNKIHCLIGDATTDEVLKDAGIEHASAIITTLPSDADNVFITLTARELNNKINIIARASDNNSEKKLYRAGATHVVMPDKLGGIHMAQLIAKPYVIEFLELLSGVGDDSIALDEISFEDLKHQYHQKSLRELDIRKKTGVTVIGLKMKDHGFHLNPDANTMINSGDILIILGTAYSIRQFRSRFLENT